jgi:hypothetical protein
MKTAKQINDQMTGEITVITSFEEYKRKYLPQHAMDDELILKFLNVPFNAEQRNRIIEDAKLFYGVKE